MPKAETLDTLAGLAMFKLRGFLEGGDHTGKDIAEAKIASGIVSSWVRNKQTDSALQATNFMMARELAQDRQQLETYIRLTNPQSALVKALPPAA